MATIIAPNASVTKDCVDLSANGIPFGTQLLNDSHSEFLYGVPVTSLTQTDVEFVAQVIHYGIHLLKEINSDSHSSRKLLTLLTDIHNVFARAGLIGESDGVDKTARNVLCSTCSSLLPDVPAYAACMMNCTP